VGALVIDENSGEIRSVELGGSKIQPGMSYRQLKRILGRDYSIEAGEDNASFIIVSNLGGDYFCFYFKGRAEDGVLDWIYATGGY
jgi:hypothetical protein